jgi:hypothetical protein
MKINWDILDLEVNKVIAKHDSVFKIEGMLKRLSAEPTDKNGDALISTCGLLDYRCRQLGMSEYINIESESIFKISTADTAFLNHLFVKINSASKVLKINLFCDNGVNKQKTIKSKNLYFSDINYFCDDYPVRNKFFLWF